MKVDCGLLGDDVVYSCRWFVTFWKNIAFIFWVEVATTFIKFPLGILLENM
jgi:hypothetical protein